MTALRLLQSSLVEAQALDALGLARQQWDRASGRASDLYLLLVEAESDARKAKEQYLAAKDHFEYVARLTTEFPEGFPNG